MTVARTVATMPVPGSIVGIYDDQGTALGSNPTLSSSHGTHYPGQYTFLVRTSQKVAVKGGPMFSSGNASLTLPCSPWGMMLFVRAAAADDPNFLPGLGGVPSVPSGNGSYNYYVTLDFMGSYPLGQTRAGQLSLSFENVATAALPVTMLPDTATATIDVTIDHKPSFNGAGNLYPWGSTNLTAGNASLGSSGVARVGAGNWETQTAGDDLVGMGVQLGAGWKVTSTTIKSAVSAASPQDLSPDNAWRGASVTTSPQGTDLRTAVHWHYSGIDSIDYTVEWQLTGPLGERPLTTMAKYGACDN
jgi:hypothetical protein